MKNFHVVVRGLEWPGGGGGGCGLWGLAGGGIVQPMAPAESGECRCFVQLRLQDCKKAALAV